MVPKHEVTQCWRRMSVERGLGGTAHLGVQIASVAIYEAPSSLNKRCSAIAYFAYYLETWASESINLS
jgi:hypothetical protein